MAWAYEYQDLPLDGRTQRIMVNTKVVLIALANYAGPNGTDAFPSVARIQRDTGLSERAIQYALRALEDHGTIAETPDPLVRSSTIGRADLRPKSYDLAAYIAHKRGAKSTGDHDPEGQRGAKSKIDNEATGCKISNDFAPDPVLNQPPQPKPLNQDQPLEDLNLDQKKEDAGASSSSATPSGVPDLDPHSDPLDTGAEQDQPLFDTVNDQPEPTATPTRRSRPRKPRTEQPRDDVDQLCQRLRDRIVANGSKTPTITVRWRDQARLLLDTDHRPLDKALRLIDWCQDHHFWRTNILSMAAFRAKYDQLRLQALDEYAHRNGNGPTNGHRGSGHVPFTCPPSEAYAAAVANGTLLR